MEAVVEAPIAKQEPRNGHVEGGVPEVGARPFKWSAEDYLKASELGVFGDRRTELIEGEIIEMSPHSPAHIVGVGKTQETLRFALPRDFIITGQSTYHANETSKPEPDIAVFRGDWNDLYAENTLVPVLVVEVSRDTLTYDQTRKASLYASLGVRDYWILNLIDNRLEIRREPRVMPNEPSGWGYASLTLHAPDETVSPLELSQVSLQVRDLLL